MILLGLGSIGKNILENFENIDTLLIDDFDHQDYKTALIQAGTEGQYKHEKYDSADLTGLNLSQYKDTDVYLVVSGGSDISGASMRILEALGGANVSVIYIKPEKDSMTNFQELQERVTYSVLQESARSGMLKQIILFSNEHIASCIENVSIKNYYSSINQHIVFALNAHFFCEENTPAFGKKRDYEELNRIVSLGRVHEGGETLFFPLTNERKQTKYPLSKTYSFLYPEKDLDKPNLLKEVKDELKTINGSLEDINFGIFEIEANSAYKMVLVETSLVQE